MRLWSSVPLEESRRGPRTLPVEAALFLIISGTSILEVRFFFGTFGLSGCELLSRFVGGRDSTEPPRAVATPNGLEGDKTVELETLSMLPNSLALESCDKSHLKNLFFFFSSTKQKVEEFILTALPLRISLDKFALIACIRSCWHSWRRLLVEDFDFSRPWARNLTRASSMKDSGTFWCGNFIFPT